MWCVWVRASAVGLSVRCPPVCRTIFPAISCNILSSHLLPVFLSSARVPHLNIFNINIFKGSSGLRRSFSYRTLVITRFGLAVSCRSAEVAAGESVPRRLRRGTPWYGYAREITIQRSKLTPRSAPRFQKRALNCRGIKNTVKLSPPASHRHGRRGGESRQRCTRRRRRGPWRR